MKRASSPAPSENEVDILDSLFTEDAELAEEDQGPRHKRAKTSHPSTLDLDFGHILDASGGHGGVPGDGPGSHDDEGDDDEAFIASLQRSSNRKSSKLQGKTVKKGGGFQAMGLDARLLRAITRKGFSVPTPIQRKAIPLALEGRDVVGMARTGSGKTAAFVIPMIERLRAHSARVGARALVLSPSRELALQTLRVVKDFGRGTDLKSVLLVGGDSLEEQFGLMASNPDIVIATPGRFLHLKVEMSLDLSSVRYVVFDEADRLFEMGFAAQLTEILHALPPSRQTLLFSATLPSSLVDFARAGLQDPSLVRLDTETKVSPDLESAFFSVKGPEKEGALLHILFDVIKMPVGLPEGGSNHNGHDKANKRRRGPERPKATEMPTEHSTIIFTATKHHVEYLATLLTHAGFAVSYVYGSLDQTARRTQVEDFRWGRSNILVVTDVAARGIDIPVLANVINYDFPPQPKIFVHRIGRTARAGQRGWAYSLVRESDAPYLLDLQLFLGRRLIVGQEEGAKDPSVLAREIVVGSLKRAELETQAEWVGKVLGDSEDMDALRRVAVKAEKLYLRTRNSASIQSVKRAREMVSSHSWMQLHPLFGEDAAAAEHARAGLLAKISNFKPAETIFEIGVVSAGGTSGSSHRAGRVSRAAEVARNLRSNFCSKRKGPLAAAAAAGEGQTEVDMPSAGEKEDGFDESSDEVEVAVDELSDEEELEVTVSGSTKTKGQQSSFQDPEIFMTYTPRATNMATERGLGVHTGSSSTNPNFVEAARDAAMDLVNDEGGKSFGAPARARLRWDKKQSKYVARANDEDGSHGSGRGRLIVGESGVKIAASFKSGRFDKWRRANRLGRLPRVGDAEKSFRALASAPGADGSRAATPGGQAGGQAGGGGGGGRRFTHMAEKAPKEADKYRDDYHVRKRRVAEAKEKRVGRFRDGEGSRRELKSAVDIRKARELKEKKKVKNARPSRSGKGGKGRR